METPREHPDSSPSATSAQEADAREPAVQEANSHEAGFRETGPTRKPRPNHQRMLQILRGLTPQQKLEQVFQLNERTLHLLRIGLRQRFPDLDEAAFEKVYLQLRARCHNRNY